MMTFVYDGSFDGLLCVLGYVLENGYGQVEIKSESYYTIELFSDKIKIETDVGFSESFLSKLLKISPEFQKILLFTYHSEEKVFETKLLGFIRLAIMHCKLPGDYSNLDVKYVMNLVRQVGLEIHRYKGFLRFSEMDDKTLFAPFAPKYNIISFLGRHFINRMPYERWIIFDTKRNISMEWDGKNLVFRAFEGEKLKKTGFSQSERDVNRLWQAYFKEIAIKERINPQLQKRLMPKRYWKYLTEMQVVDE